MIIGGFQKFSLLEYPGELTTIVFTQGCNFRCPYCHNPQLVDPKRHSTPIPEDTFWDFLYTRRNKLTAVTITGGEPTYQADLIPFLRKIKDLGFLVKLDTNGSYPMIIKEIIMAGLSDYWAMDIKAPLSLYPLITKCDITGDTITASMDLIRESGKRYEFRTTFFNVLFNWKDINEIRELLKPGDKFYLQQCRYNYTLDNLSNGDAGDITLSNDTIVHLVNHPACQNLVEWGSKNYIEINIRSI